LAGNANLAGGPIVLRPIGETADGKPSYDRRRQDFQSRTVASVMVSAAASSQPGLRRLRSARIAAICSGAPRWILAV